MREREIELLEKLVVTQEILIEKMNDYNSLRISYETFKEVKIGKINNLQNEIEQKDERIAVLEKENAELNTIIDKFKESVPTDIIDRVYDDDEQ